jgi:hypothetical protein
MGEARTGDLQDRHWHAQCPTQEGDEDQPEGPTPSPHNTECKQRDELSERRQEGDLRHLGASRQSEAWS